jgi:hypothetical protein
MNFFKTAERFNILTDKFLFRTWFMWFDMIGNPLIMVAIAVFTKKLPSILSLFGLVKTVQLWVEWYEYKTVKSRLVEWKNIVDAANGPFISTNNNAYLSYVYADGMQRLFNNQMTHQVHPIPPKNPQM